MKIRSGFIIISTLFLVGCGTSQNEAPHVHEFSEWEIIQEATCTEKGIRQRDCACGEIQKDEIDIIEHSLIDVKPVESTCTTKGNTAGQECTECNYTTVEEIDMLEHKLDEGIVLSAPDCETPGERECTCLVCGGTIIEEIPVIEHSYDDGVITWVEENGIEKGIITYTCTVCGNTKYATRLDLIR